MYDNCIVFTNSYRQELRVVFDPDGKAFFNGVDLAVIAGYSAPRKAVTGGNQGVNRIDSVLRKFPWDNGIRRGRCDYTSFSAENAVKFLCRRPAPYDAIRWFEDEVLPQVDDMGEKVARGFVEWPEKAKKKPKEPEGRITPKEGNAPLGAVLARLDAIILECALLKKELYQTR